MSDDTDRDRERSHRRDSPSRRSHSRRYERDRGSSHRRRYSRSRSPVDSRSRSRRDRDRSPRRYDTSRNRGRSDRGYDNKRGTRGKAEVDPERQKELEMLEITRDARTIFVGQLVSRAKEKDIREFFEEIGPVIDVQLIRDRNTGRSRGMGYVEFKDIDSVAKAVMLNGQKFMGYPVLVKQSEAEKNYAFEAETEGGTIFSDNANRRVYVGNLHPDVGEDDLRQIFGNIGEIDRVSLMRDPQGVSRCYGFVVFKDQFAVNAALTSLAGLDLAGHKLKVGMITPAGEIRDASGNTWTLDGENSASLSAQARAALIANLSTATNYAAAQLGATLHQARQQVNDDTVTQAQTTVPEEGPGPHGEPSRYIVFSNVFDPDAQNEKYWDLAILDDIDDECSKHGEVLSVRVDLKDPSGCVYVKMNNTKDGEAAAKKIAGRHYAGRIIVAKYLSRSRYERRRPESN